MYPRPWSRTWHVIIYDHSVCLWYKTHNRKTIKNLLKYAFLVINFHALLIIIKSEKKLIIVIHPLIIGIHTFKINKDVLKNKLVPFDTVHQYVLISKLLDTDIIIIISLRIIRNGWPKFFLAGRATFLIMGATSKIRTFPNRVPKIAVFSPCFHLQSFHCWTPSTQIPVVSTFAYTDDLTIVSQHPVVASLLLLPTTCNTQLSSNSTSTGWRSGSPPTGCLYSPRSHHWLVTSWLRNSDFNPRCPFLVPPFPSTP